MPQTILIVDDDPTQRRLLGAVAGEQGQRTVRQRPMQRQGGFERKQVVLIDRTHEHGMLNVAE